MCLSPKTRLDSGLSVSDVVISFTYGSDDRGSDITLEYSEDAQIGGMVLKLTADGY